MTSLIRSGVRQSCLVLGLTQGLPLLSGACLLFEAWPLLSGACLLLRLGRHILQERSAGKH